MRRDRPFRVTGAILWVQIYGVDVQASDVRAVVDDGGTRLGLRKYQTWARAAERGLW